MTKDDLKEYIKKLGLPNELEELLFELIDKAPEVNQLLLNTIADILDLQADFYEKEAEIMEEVAEEYDKLIDEFNLLSEEKRVLRLEAIEKNQQELLEAINSKINELKTATNENQKIEEIKQNLQQQTQ